VVRKSAFISIALHLAILLWVLVVFPSGRALDAPKIEDVPIDIVTPSEFTKIKAGMVDAKDDAPLAAKPEDPKPKAVTEKEASKPPKTDAAVPPPPAQQAKAEQPPKPKPEKVEKPKEAEAKKEPLPKKADAKPEKPKDKPKPKPAPQAEQKHDLNADRLAALLNKIPSATKEPPAVDAPQNTLRKPVKGRSSGTQMTMAVNEIDALRAKIAQCWSPPPGGLGADAIVIKLRLRLNEDGSLVGYPTVANSGGSPFFQAAADSAVRAVFQCQPYELPSEKYAVWRDMILNFDPRQMYGSG
jgi:outer membrane biosynthesis protein TonB